jgi:hypothetical protein
MTDICINKLVKLVIADKRILGSDYERETMLSQNGEWKQLKNHLKLIQDARFVAVQHSYFILDWKCVIVLIRVYKIIQSDMTLCSDLLFKK